MLYVILEKDLATGEVEIADAFEDEARAQEEINRLISLTEDYGYKIALMEK